MMRSAKIGGNGFSEARNGQRYLIEASELGFN
jgi:hypothetical protein